MAANLLVVSKNIVGVELSGTPNTRIVHSLKRGLHCCMPMASDKMLAVLLVLFLALGSVGSAFAVSHACGFDDGGITAVEHSAHMRMTSASIDDMTLAGEPDLCRGCSPDCCVSGACMSDPCGSSAPALVSVQEVSLSFSGGFMPPDSVDRPVVGRQIPPFRPPRS